MEHSGEDFSYTDPFTGDKYIPYCIEPSLGWTGCCLRPLRTPMTRRTWEAGFKDCAKAPSRPCANKAAVFPSKTAGRPLNFTADCRRTVVDYDEAGSIGKRYRRHDEVGTPFCITYDFDSVNDNSVTVRERDSMEQIRISIDELEAYLQDKLEY